MFILRLIHGVFIIMSVRLGSYMMCKNQRGSPYKLRMHLSYPPTFTIALRNSKVF